MSNKPANPGDASGIAPPKGGAARWVQAAGFVIGLVLLSWCIWLVIRDQKRMDEVRRLAASPSTLATLVGISIGVSVCTGMMFRSIASPVVRLPVLDVLAVNSIATLLGNLPFKLSLVARGYIHRTRNGVPVPTIIAWMGAALCVMAIGVLPPLVATLVLKRVDGVWWGTVVGGTLVLAAAAVVCGRLTRMERFWTWVASVGERCPRTIGRATRWPGFAEFRRGPAMLASPTAVGQSVLWRSAAMGFGVWRFAVAAAAVGGAGAMTIGQCVVADSVYFSIQAAAPTGALGAREGGTVAAIAAMAGEQLPVVVLAVSAAETTANLLCAAVSLLYLKLTHAQKCTTGEPGCAAP